MAEDNNIVSKRPGKIICQDGELDFEDPAVEEGFSDLKAAIMTGRTDIVRIILSAAQSYRDDEESFSDDEENDENVKESKDQEVLDLLQMLLNFRDNDAGTGLHYATKSNQTDIVRSLLAAGANPTLKNLENATAYDYCKTDAMKTAYVGALMQAVAQSMRYRVKLLLQAGVDVNSGDGAESDNKILHWAASFADANIVRLLIESNANVNATNADGSTALHDAISRGDEQIVLELLEHGAKIDIVPFKGPMKGKSCYDLSESKTNIRNLIESYMVKGKINGDAFTANDQDETASNTSSIPSLPNISPLLSPVSGSTQSGQVNGENGNEEHVNGEHTPKEDSNLSIQSSNTGFTPILLPPKSPMKLFFPTLVELDSAVSQLWPPPQKISQYKGTSYVPPLSLPFVLMSSKNTTQDSLLQLVDIIEIMKPKFKSTGFDLENDILSSYSTISSSSKGSVECFLDETAFHHTDEYRLHISTRKVKIVASSSRAMFYAFNTFLQCLRIFQGKSIPLLQISDWPDMNFRGVQVDYHQGDLPKLGNFLQFLDILSEFKVNQVHLPAEMFLPHDQHKYVYYTRCDLLYIHKFCKERYMEIIPVLRTSDILGNFSALSFASIKADILPLFPSTRYLNVSLSDHEDQPRITRNTLGGITDNDLVRKIEELHEFCISNGLTLLLDSEMILQQPVKLLDMNHNLVCLNMSEESKKEATCEYLYDLGIPHVEAPAYRDMDTILNDARTGLKHFETSSRKAAKCGALGMIIRFEAKPCLCSFSVDIASLAIGAAMAWKSSPSVIVDEDMLTGILNRHIYQDDNDMIGQLMLNLGSVEQIEIIGKRDLEKSIQDIELTDNHKVHKPCFLRALLGSVDDLNNHSVSLESLKLITVSLKQLEGRIGKCKLKCDAREMVIGEVTFLIKIFLFLCRVGVTLQKTRKADNEISITDLTEIQRSDLSNKLMGLTEIYETFCRSHYNETHRGLISVQLMKTLLAKLYPKREPSFFNSISRAFTV